MSRLNHDPYGCFRGSTTPVGLYARQKWIGTDADKTWHSDFESCVAALWDGQLQDGSWGGSFIRTVHRLFGLHLTVRHPTKETGKALDWLLDRARSGTKSEDFLHSPDDLRGLPFVSGHQGSLLVAMLLFLSSIFGRADDPDVVVLYEELSNRTLRNLHGCSDHPDMSNILRAFVVHPVYAGSEATVLLVESLSLIQEGSGLWPKTVPFFQTVNALAHLQLPQAEKQLEKAFRVLAETQNSDGTWGDIEKAWNTFLVVHAMRNKKIAAIQHWMIGIPTV